MWENSVLNKIKFAFDEVLPWEFSIFDSVFVNSIFNICENSQTSGTSNYYLDPYCFKQDGGFCRKRKNLKLPLRKVSYQKCIAICLTRIEDGVLKPIAGLFMDKF